MNDTPARDDTIAADADGARARRRWPPGAWTRIPAWIYTDPGIYTVVMTATANGCNDSDTLLVVVNSPVVVSDIFVPNVFTPNGDGQNDAWGVESVGLSSLNAQVFNRWGQLVAELRAPDRSWDGRTEASQPAPEGTYYYVLQAEGADGRSYRFTGSLTLLR